MNSTYICDKYWSSKIAQNIILDKSGRYLLDLFSNLDANSLLLRSIDPVEI